jgi:hypothetical protein
MYQSYTKEFIKQVLEENKTQSGRSLGRKYGFNHTNIIYWKKIDLEKYKEKEKDGSFTLSEFLISKSISYSYILGLYLGDGYINPVNNTYLLKITMDSKYQLLNDYVLKQLHILFPTNSVNRIKHKHYNMDILSVYNPYLDILFPHLGKGLKYKRKIELQDWQKDLLNPVAFIQGLIHSDGCFYIHYNKYPAFCFSNMSTDIKQLFINAINSIDIKPTYKDINKKNIYIYGKHAKKLLELIGTKTDVMELINK